jgi:hypothetical protein
VAAGSGRRCCIASEDIGTGRGCGAKGCGTVWIVGVAMSRSGRRSRAVAVSVGGGKGRAWMVT